MKGSRLKDVLDDTLVDKPFWDKMFAKLGYKLELKVTKVQV